MQSNPRLRRLEADYRGLLDLKSRSDLVDFKVLGGSPPERYKVTFGCKGVMLNPTTSKPTITIKHAVEIYLGADYPSCQPQMKWQTNIYHPNIRRSDGTVCIQYWYASMPLADLVIMLGNMVRYENYNPDSPLDQHAAVWARQNTHRFPVDERPLLAPEVNISISGQEHVHARQASEEIAIRLL